MDIGEKWRFAWCTNCGDRYTRLIDSLSITLHSFQSFLNLFFPFCVDLYLCAHNHTHYVTLYHTHNHTLYHNHINPTGLDLPSAILLRHSYQFRSADVLEEMLVTKRQTRQNPHGCG